MTQKTDYSAIRVETAPTAEPVSVAELKANLRLNDTTWDATVLPLLIEAARQAVENECNRALINTTFQQFYDEWPYSSEYPYIELVRAPVASVSSIKYIDTDGDEQTWTASNYRVDMWSQPARVELAYAQSWPAIRQIVNSITIEYVAGYGASSASVPDALRQAVLMLASDMFEHSESQAESALHDNRTVMRLIQAYKIPTVY